MIEREIERARLGISEVIPHGRQDDFAVPMRELPHAPCSLEKNWILVPIFLVVLECVLRERYQRFQGRRDILPCGGSARFGLCVASTGADFYAAAMRQRRGRVRAL